MPELPEVETIRRDLRKCLVGRTIRSVEILRASVLLCSPRKLKTALTGATVEDVRRRGKVLILDFTGDVSLLVHLRMTGQLLVCDHQPRGAGFQPASVRARSELPDYTRVLFHRTDGGTLVYADCRALGKLELCGTDGLAASCSLANFGPDALDSRAPRRLTEAAGRRRLPIKCLLLDQKVIAGIGNIYASEILHSARIAPDRPANTLSGEDVKRLHRAVRRVLKAAIKGRGTTLSDYRTGLGERGEYSSRLKVYGREGKRCRRRGCRGVIQRLVQQQRSTFYCPDCQK